MGYNGWSLTSSDHTPSSIENDNNDRLPFSKPAANTYLSHENHMIYDIYIYIYIYIIYIYIYIYHIYMIYSTHTQTYFPF